MHELSITAGIMDVLLKEAQAGEFERIKQVNIVIGDMAGVEGQCVKYYFELMRENTPASEALLTFETARSKFRCHRCGDLYERCDFSLLCPTCGGRGTITEICSSLYIESIEVE